MLLRRSAKRHQSGVDSTIWWEFQPGDRVLTAEGIFGRVTAVEDGPHPGNEQYLVELDMGLGGGEYTASELRNPDSDSVESGFGGVHASHKTGTLWAGHRYDQEVYVSDPTELSGYREHGGVRATFMTRGQHGAGSYTTFADLESAIEYLTAEGFEPYDKYAKLSAQYVVEDEDSGDIVSGPFDDREQAQEDEEYQEENRPEDDNLITMRQGTLRLSQRDPENPNEGLDLAEELAAEKDYTHSGLVVKALDSGRLLLTQRTPYEGDPEGVYGRWEFPGGSVDNSGDPIASAIREFEEETGLVLPEDHHIDGAYASDTYLAVVILVPNEAWTAMASLLMHETEGVGWFSIDDVKGTDLIREEMDDADWDMIREALKKDASDLYGPAWEDVAEALATVELTGGMGGFWERANRLVKEYAEANYMSKQDVQGKFQSERDKWISPEDEAKYDDKLRRNFGSKTAIPDETQREFISYDDEDQLKDKDEVEHYASDDYPELAEVLVDRPPLQGRTRVKASKTANREMTQYGNEVSIYPATDMDRQMVGMQGDWYWIVEAPSGHTLGEGIAATEFEAEQEAKRIEELFRHKGKQAVLQIREYNYRGEDGWLIVGTDGRGRGGQKVFVPEEMGRDAAEGIREKMKAGEDWSFEDFKQAGFLDRVLSPVGDYMVQNQTFMPDTIEVVPGPEGKLWAILGYDEHGDRRVIGHERTKQKAEQFAEEIRQNNSPSARAPKPRPKPFRETKKADRLYEDVDDIGSGGGVVEEVADALGDIVDEEEESVFEARRIARNDREFQFHFTAAWSDIQEKASRIRGDGHVRVISASPAYIAGEVRGDTDIYQTILHREGSTNRVALWECGCAWASYSWGRSGRWKKFEGRMCSHALALLYETQSRGWGGAEIAEDAEKPKWLSDPSIVVQRPGDYKKPGGGNWRLDASLRKGAPFAGYDSFDDCVSQNQDKDDPEAYCGSIKHQVEGARPVDTDPFLRPPPAVTLAKSFDGDAIAILRAMGVRNPELIIRAARNQMSTKPQSNVNQRKAAVKCPKSGQKSTRFPGIDQCEYCGRDVRTKQDGTYAEHNMPSDRYWDDDPTEPPPTPITGAKGEKTGAMIALRPPDEVLDKIALEGGEPFEDLHITLGFLGKAEEVDDLAVQAAVKAWAFNTSKLAGNLTGYGVFHNKEGERVLYASVNIPGLTDARQQLVETLDTYGVKVANDYEFLPHLTLAYGDVEAPEKFPHEASGEFDLSEAFVVMAGQWTSIPLRESELKDDPEPALPEATGDEGEIDADEFTGEETDLAGKPHEAPEAILDEDPDDIGKEEDLPPVESRAWLMEGSKPSGSGGGDVSDSDIALAAKQALKEFSPDEQRALIMEGEVEGASARNLDRLDVAGTHYEALEMALEEEESENDDVWLMV